MKDGTHTYQTHGVCARTITFTAKNGTYYNNTYIGFGSDLQAKVQLWRFISAAAGITLSLDPYWLELSKDSGKWYYSHNNDFLNLAFNCHIGITFDF